MTTINSSWIFLANLASTLFMTGVIWFVQVVHYPLFDHVGPDGFARYHAEHSRLTTYVVILPMTVELLTSIWLVANRPAQFPAWLVWAGLAAALGTWLSTAFVQVPLHEKLAGGFDPSHYASLVRTNGYRAWIWTAHAVIVLVMAAKRMG